MAFGRPVVGEATVSYLDRPTLPARRIDLPFRDTAEQDGVVFRIDAAVSRFPLSSSRLRVAPDECIESVAVNGVEVPHFGDLDAEKRCWPRTYTLDGGGDLRPGDNTLRLVVTNKEGPHGVGVTPVLAPAHVLLAAAFAWLSLRAALTPLLAAVPHAARLALPALGGLMIAGQLANARGAVSATDQPLVFLAAAAAAVWLLARALDRQRDRPLVRRPSRGWAAVSAMAFAVASVKSLSTYEPVPRFLLTLLGTLAGGFAATPVFAALHRARRAPAAVAVAAVGATAPLACDQFRLTLWEWLVAPTTHAVAAVVSATGTAAATGFGTKVGDDGRVWDYHGYVTSPGFSVQIGSWCGGFEGMALFLFLLSAFVLYDWRLFSSRARRLWVPFAAALPYLFAVNVLRISAIFLYALLVAGEVGHEAARNAAVESFHSNAGWVVYAVAFGPYLWAVYRWAGRRGGRRPGR